MQLVNLTKTVVVALLCHLIAHGAEMPNERNSPEGVDFDDDYKIEVTHGDSVVDSTAIDKGHHATITVTVSAFCKTFTIDLKLNSFLFSADYAEISFNENGAVHHDVDQKKRNCFYLGEVRNEEYSSAAISTCKGIDGFFAVGNISYHIESQSDRFSGPHKVYKTRSDAKTTYKCGHDEVPLRTLLNPLRHARRLKRAFIWPQDGDKKNKIVELYVVADNSTYVRQGSSVPATTQRIIQIVNIANAGYQPLGIYLMLVTIEVWSSENKINVDENNKTSTLAEFAAYRRNTINPQTYNDDGVLVTSKIFDQGTVLGYAYVGRMCSYRFAAALVSDSHEPAAVAGAVMDHEIGHNFGLIHDDAYAGPCPCSDPTAKCIMNSAPSSSEPATTWSKCSLVQFDTVFNQSADLCLYNVPKMTEPNTSFCGNGIVEGSEQCDCGNSSSQQCNRACCDATTCQLIAPAVCAFGRCCDISKCQILPAGTSCRVKADTSCDLEEFCDGAASLCKSDTYAPDGTACTIAGAPAYCYKGLCRNREYQCELLWGPGTKVSVDRCYDLNTRDNEFYANCGIDSWVPTVNYTSCAPSDVKCGLLQCEDVTLPPYTYKYPMTNSQTKFPNGSTCHSALFDFGTAVQNPGLVPDGASCGDGQMCISQKCVNVSNVLVASCSSCLPGQACNNLGQCQDITQTIRPTTTAIFTTTAVPSSAVLTSSIILLSESPSTMTSTSTPTTTPTTTSTTTTSTTTSPSRSPTTVSTPTTTVQSDEAKVISLSLGIALGAVGAVVATSLGLIGLCFPGFFSFLFKACSPWTPAKSTAELPDAPLDDMPWPAGPVPMPSRMHWSPAANYFNTPPPRGPPVENPSEFYYPQNSPDWRAMQRAMPFWRNENDYRYKLFPERISNFSPEGV